jgi:hypothetical protein
LHFFGIRCHHGDRVTPGKDEEKVNMESEEINTVAKQLGFADYKEMFALIRSVNMTTPERAHDFKKWQANDGTKAGLLKLKEKKYE